MDGRDKPGHDALKIAVTAHFVERHCTTAAAVWKVRLVHAANPDWRDLYEDLNA